MENIMIEGLELLKEVLPVVQTSIPVLASAFLAAFFTRGNTAVSEFEKLKQAQFADVAQKLLDDGYITYVEYWKCKNFLQIAKKADEVYGHNLAADGNNADNKNESESDDKKISFDWFMRFFEEAGNISDEQVQDLWAKVLAGEIKSPGSFSLRFIETLRTLSKDEAEILQEISSYAVALSGDYYICLEEDLCKKYGYLRKLPIMYDCGILSDNDTHSLTTTSHGAGIFMRTKNLICFCHNEKPENFRVDIRRFTKAGREFMMHFAKPNHKFLLDFLRFINDKWPNLKLTAHYGLIIDDNMMTLEPNLLIKSEDNK